jgi:serine/threonine-protein kinase
MPKGPIPGWGEPEPPSTGAAPQSPAAAEGTNDPATEPAPTGPVQGEVSTVPLPSMAADLNDRMLGEFRILRRLGVGGMAEVYLAEQTSLHRNVAVKVLHKDRVADAGYLQRFKTEAMAAGSLNHPNIIQVLMIGEEDGYRYIAQEYVAGMNLREFLARKGPPELALALRIMKQATSALQAAHNAGIVHRDIKPENIMLTRKGEVKVADFGLAQLTQRGERVNLTQTGVTMGTPLYMSPEQVSGSKLDLRTDIYSLGVTCYHMLSGHPPFRGETAISVAVQHLKQDPASLEAIRGDLPPLLCRIVHKMMAKAPERRYQSAQALLKDLKRVTAEEAEEQPTSEFELLTVEDPGAPRDNSVVRLLKGIWYSPDRPFSRQLAVVLILAVLAGGAAGGVGWIARVPNPLAAPLPLAPAVDKKEKAASQYYFALTLKDSIEAWQAVIDNFPAPADRLYVNYAKQQLATLLMAKRRFDEAQQIFDELAALGEGDPQFRAFGIAGQAILLNVRGDYNQSQRVLDRLQSPVKSASADATLSGAAEPARKSLLLFDLLDDKMRQAVTETIHRNVDKLNKQMSQEWDEVLKTHEHAEPTPANEGPR